MYPQLPRTPAGRRSGSGSRRGSCGEVKIGDGRMKYAIVEDGGKQYRAVEGSTIEVDYYPSEIGEQIDMERVLLIADDEGYTIGAPLISGAKIQATVVEQIKGPKVTVFKYKPKIRYRVKTGHRQKYTRLMIDSILLETE
jgi:large subunit ribosomal protein L21